MSVCHTQRKNILYQAHGTVVSRLFMHTTPRTMNSTIHIPECKCQSNKNIRQPRNKEKTKHSPNTSLFTFALFRVQQTNSHKRHARKSVTHDKILACFKPYRCGSYQLCRNPSGYNLGRDRRHSVQRLSARSLICQ